MTEIDFMDIIGPFIMAIIISIILTLIIYVNRNNNDDSILTGTMIERIIPETKYTPRIVPIEQKQEQIDLRLWDIMKN